MAKKPTTSNQSGFDSRDPSEPMNEAKRAVLDKALGDIVKRYGEGSIMRMGEAHHMTVEAIPTGSLSLDIALGVGGIPRGRITEIYGPESSGKTTICQHIVAEAQKLGGMAAYIDMEHALDPRMPPLRRGYREPAHLTAGYRRTGPGNCETLVRSGAVDVVVIDSVAALVPRAEIEGDMGDASMGMQARLMSQALRKLSGAINQTKTAVIFTNQLRQKIGVMFGNPETTPGGLALKFYASVRLDVRRIQSIKVGRGNRRQPGARARGEEQGCPALPHRRIRHHVQRRHLQSRRYHRPGDPARDRHQARRILLLRRYPPGPGPRKCQRIPAPES